MAKRSWLLNKLSLCVEARFCTNIQASLCRACNFMVCYTLTISRQLPFCHLSATSTLFLRTCLIKVWPAEQKTVCGKKGHVYHCSEPFTGSFALLSLEKASFGWSQC